DPDAVGAEGQRRRETASVEDAAGRDDGNRAVDRVDDQRYERERRHGARVAARFGPLGDDYVAPGVERSSSVLDLAAHRDHQNVVLMAEVDDLARHAESGEERRGAAL